MTVLVVSLMSYSLFPGDIRIRLRQLLWIGIALSGAIFAFALAYLMLLSREGLFFWEVMVFGVLAALLGKAFHMALKRVDGWVADLSEHDISTENR